MMTDYDKRPLIYQHERMNRAQIHRNRVYNDDGFTLDIYTPEETPSPRPAVIFVHGDGAPEMISTIKNWRIYADWCRLITTLGFVGVVFNHRSSLHLTQPSAVLKDVEDAVDYVRNHADEYTIDPNRIAIFGISFGVPYASVAVLKNQWDFVRCLVNYYGFLNLTHLPEHNASLTVTSEDLKLISPLNYVENPMPPTLIMRAGQDNLAINATVMPFITAGLEHNQPITFINYPEGEHGFDMSQSGTSSEQIIRQTLLFIQMYLAD